MMRTLARCVAACVPWPAGPGRLTTLLVLAVIACGERQTDRPIARGAALYAANCATCHGPAGEGAPDWRVERPDGCLPPPPHDSSGHTWHHGDGLLYRIVKGGGASLGIAQFKSCMPAFGDRLTDSEIRAVITHLETLWGPRERQFQAEVSRQDLFP